MKTCIELTVNERRGAGYVASCNIPAGSTILKCTPVVQCLNRENLPLYCTTCLRGGEGGGVTLNRCSSCKSVFYCSRQCQGDDWYYHKKECPHLKNVTTTMRLLLRIGLKDMRDSKHSLSGLVNHRDQPSDLDAQSRSTAVSMLCCSIMHGLRSGAGGRGEGGEAEGGDDEERDRILGGPYGIEYFINLVFTVMSNAFTMTTSDLQPIGTAIYGRDGSTFNHSCSPNSHALFAVGGGGGGEMTVRPLRPILEGEEITIGYIELGEGRDERQRVLRESYFFDCACSRCSGGHDAPFTYSCRLSRCGGNVSTPTESSPSPRCSLCNSHGPTVGEIRSLEAELKVLEDGLSPKPKPKPLSQTSNGGEREWLLKSLEGSLFLHPSNARRALFENQVMNSAISSSQWDIALTAAERSLVGFRHIYPPDSPLPALQSSIAGKLCWRLGKYEEGKLHLQAALARLQVSHGVSHPIVASLFNILNEMVHGEKGRESG